MNESALLHQGPELEEQPNDGSDADSEDKSHHGHGDESGLSEDGSPPDELEGGDSASEEEVLDISSKILDQSCCSVGMKIRCVSGTITNVPKHSKSLNKAEARVIVALRMPAESQIVKRPRSPSSVAVSDKDQSLASHGSRIGLGGSPSHKKLKVCRNFSLT